jgi:hypothetical protein
MLFDNKNFGHFWNTQENENRIHGLMFQNWPTMLEQVEYSGKLFSFTTFSHFMS